MPTVVNMHQAKTQLSKLVAKAASGEEVVIAKNGKPVARLVPVVASFKTRPMGVYAGKIRIDEDFDAPLPPEFMKAFE